MFPPRNQVPPQISDPKQAVMVMQIICGALMMGVLMFAGFAAFMQFGMGGRPPAAQPMIAYMAAGFAALIVTVRMFVVPNVIRSSITQLLAYKPLDELTKLDFYPVYQVKMIVGCALLEGAAFFNVISVIIDGQLWSFGVVAALLAGIALQFPTYERVDAWAEEQLRMVR